MDLSEELRTLATRHSDELGGLPWASERERWDELVFCLVTAVGKDASAARSTVATLSGLGLLDPASLARASDPESDAAIVLRHALAGNGLPQDDARRTAALLAQVASALVARYEGKIQRYLRAQGTAMIEDFLRLVDDHGAREPELRLGVTHWLQNALDLPLSAPDESVRRFLDEHEATMEDLEAAADQIDLNLALVDDVIRADRAARTPTDGR